MITSKYFTCPDKASSLDISGNAISTNSISICCSEKKTDLYNIIESTANISEQEDINQDKCNKIYTPLEIQVAEIKEKYPDYVLIVECKLY